MELKNLMSMSLSISTLRTGGGLMGFEILPIEQGDEELYDVITITSPERWRPHTFVKLMSDVLYPYDPSDNDPTLKASDYPAVFNHLAHTDKDSGEAERD